MMKLSLAIASLLFGANAFAACPTGTTADAAKAKIDGKEICNLQGTYPSYNLVLTPDIAWVINGPVIIGDDNKNSSTLTIKAGTTIYAAPQAFLTINRGSKIFANGEANAPVVMTGLQQKRGFWGGLVIAGNGITNICKSDKNAGLANPAGFCEAPIEGVASEVAPKYGGNNNDDSSGALRYVRVEYGGYNYGTDNELNVITFYAVGRGTLVEYIQAYRGEDDGVEVFGGAVNMRYVSSIDNDDDGFDWDNGWVGAAQFVYIEVENATEKDPNGIEADNFGQNQSVEPRSNPTLSNFTIVSKGTTGVPLNGIMLRRGTGVKLYNSIVMGSFKNCLNVDDAETFKNGGKVVGSTVEQTGLVFENVLLQCNGKQIIENDANAKDPAVPVDLFSLTAWFEGVATQNNFVMSPSDKILNGVTPVAGGPALNTESTPPVDAVNEGTFEFTQVDYVGAFSSNPAKWTDGWTAQ